MKLAFTLFLSCIFVSQIISQDCPTDRNFSFTTQQQIDDFIINYPNCTELPYGLMISGSDITNLRGLANLTRIRGGLRISSNDKLLNLDGLDNLKVVKVLTIEFNPLLEDLLGLSNLKNAPEGFFCFANNSLVSLLGLDNIQYFKFIRITSNESLLNLDGLENLSEVNGEVNIYNNPALQNINAFKQLRILPSNIGIKKCPSLTTLQGLENVKEIYGSFAVDSLGIESFKELKALKYIGNKVSIRSNQNLKNLEGLEFLKTVYGNLWITANPKLIDLKPLKKLKTVEGHLSITDNDQLVDLNGLNNLISAKKGVDIYGNEQLRSLVGLESLRETGDFSIRFCPALKNLDGLEDLEVVIGFINLGDNTSLENITGLQRVKTDQLTYLTIKKCQSLSDCTIDSFCHYLTNLENPARIFSNGVGCNRRNEIDCN